MKHALLLAICAAALVVAGCTGSGNPAPPPVGTITLVKGPRVEAVVSRGGVLLNDASGNLEIQDARNFETSMEYTFQLVGYKADGTRVILPQDSWVSTDTVGTYGTLASNSGLYSTNTTVTSTNQVITAIYKGEMVSTEFAIHPRETVYVSKVIDESTGFPIADVAVNFYDKDGVLLTSVKSSAFGTFRASLSSAATQFQVDAETIPATSWRVYGYGAPTLHYEAGSVDCRAAVDPSLLFPGIVNVPTTAYIQLSSRTAAQPATDGCPP